MLLLLLLLLLMMMMKFVCVCLVVNVVQETTAREVVMLSLTEFNISDPNR